MAIGPIRKHQPLARPYAGLRPEWAMVRDGAKAPAASVRRLRGAFSGAFVSSRAGPRKTLIRRNMPCLPGTSGSVGATTTEDVLNRLRSPSFAEAAGRMWRGAVIISSPESGAWLRTVNLAGVGVNDR